MLQFHARYRLPFLVHDAALDFFRRSKLKSDFDSLAGQIVGFDGVGRLLFEPRVDIEELQSAPGKGASRAFSKNLKTPLLPSIVVFLLNLIRKFGVLKSILAALCRS